MPVFRHFSKNKQLGFDLIALFMRSIFGTFWGTFFWHAKYTFLFKKRAEHSESQAMKPLVSSTYHGSN
jgi:hypothetical protein